jgi:hypothetical protein
MNRIRNCAVLAAAGAFTSIVQSNLSLGAAAVVSDDVCTADAPTVGALRVSSPAFPVYLLRAKDGTYSTVEVDNTQNGLSPSVARRQVSLGEAIRLCARGVHVKWLDDSDDPSRSLVTEKALLPGVRPIPSNFSIISTNGQVVGGLYLKTFKVGWVGTTQWTTFNFQSSGFVGTGQHAIAVLFFDESAYTSAEKLNGNGITIGDIHLRSANNGGCGSASWPNSAIYNSQVEAFWSENNYIYGQACLTSGMADGPTYSFDVQADIYSGVAYSRAGQAATVVNVAAERNAAGRPLNIGNWSLLFASTTGPGANFVLNFSSVGRGFF